MSSNFIELFPAAHIDAEVRVPGSKSFTNRALICAVLADGKSRIVDASPSFDSRLLISALRQLGADIRTAGSDLVVGGGSLKPFAGTLDVGPAGTTMRFLGALCAATPGTDVELRGSHRMHQRPIAGMVDGLRQLGAEIEYLEKTNFPPLHLVGKPLEGGTVRMRGDVSSQFLTALLLIAPLLPDGLRLELTGDLVSASYLDMTVETMQKFGVTVEHPDPRTWVVAPGQKYRSTTFAVEADLTGATYFGGLAAVSGGTVRIRPWPKNTTQGDAQFGEILKKMGCSVRYADGSLVVRGPEYLEAVDADLTQLPDAAQTLAVIAAHATGTTRITGLSTLRAKECDRIEALQSELKKLGITTRSGPDWLEVDGGIPAKNALISTFDDHRMAMAFAIVAAKNNLSINYPHVVRKSFPDFWKTLAECGICIIGHHRIIPSIIGTTVDELVAQANALPDFLDLIELRIDALQHASPAALDDLRLRVARPAVLTCRSVAEGGQWAGTEAERIELLKYAAHQQWAFVDVELAIADRWPWKKFEKQAIVLSWHDVLGTPDDLEKIWNEMKKYPATVRKIIPTTRSAGDFEKILDLAERHAGQNLIAFGMGERGLDTRFENIRRGTWATFAAADQPTVPGQPHWSELQKILETVRCPR